jgi:hypothetical protein
MGASCGSRKGVGRPSRSRAATRSSSPGGSATRASRLPGRSRRLQRHADARPRRAYRDGGRPSAPGRRGLSQRGLDSGGTRRRGRPRHGRDGRSPRVPGPGGGPFGERLVVAIDVRDGEVAVEGWTKSSGTTAASLASDCAAAGVPPAGHEHGRDGSWPVGRQLLTDVLEAGLPVIAAARSSIDDLVAVRDLGCRPRWPERPPGGSLHDRGGARPPSRLSGSRHPRPTTR